MPGYIIHLVEARRIVEILEQKYGYRFTEGWKRSFSMGSLLPDTRRRGEKEATHFWDPADRGLLALAPRMELFEEAQGADLPLPGVMGYRVHLHLDHMYVHSFWRKNFRFEDSEGTEQAKNDAITQVRLLRTGEVVPVQAFFSSDYYYGDYTRLNQWMIETYGIRVPEYVPSDWADFPLSVVEPEDLKGVLKELQQLKQVDAEAELRVFSGDALMAFVEQTAESAAELADRILRSAGYSMRRATGVSGRVDLHAHTLCSDGSLSPRELVALAAKKHLMAIAVTDHDTMEGLEEAEQAGREFGIDVIPGMEFSTVEDGRDVHMVGLFLDPTNGALRGLLQEAADNRRKRNHRMVQNLIDGGLPITWDDVKTLGDGIWTRGNLAQLLVDKGAANTVGEAMNRYLVPGTVGYEPKVAISPEQAVAVVHEAGGLCFVAHFHQIYRKDPARSREIAERILEAGADGLETCYCEYDDFLRGQAEEMAEKFGCMRSGGSDYHGKIKPGLELADGYGDLFVPEEYLAQMKAVLEARRELAVDKK